MLSKEDPTIGFRYDASSFAGNVHPSSGAVRDVTEETDDLSLRLRLASHLAQHIRHQLEEHKRFTSTAGISTSKLLSKLVGNLHKPNAQTTLLPPYNHLRCENSNVLSFIGEHEIAKIPGIGYKLAQKIREHVLQREAPFKDGILVGRTKDIVLVKEVRTSPLVNPEKLQSVLGGPGSRHDVGQTVWKLIHGVDDTEVASVRDIPRQISIEDSYLGVSNMTELRREMTSLSKNLIRRMHVDLVGPNIDEISLATNSTEEPVLESTKQNEVSMVSKRWLAHPKTIRLTTRLKRVPNPDGTRKRTFNRSSRSTPVPNFIFNLTESIAVLAEKLVSDTLLPLFRKLHPENTDWNITIINIAITGMIRSAGDSKTAGGRDIGRMMAKRPPDDETFGPNMDHTLMPGLSNPATPTTKKQDNRLKHGDRKFQDSYAKDWEDGEEESNDNDWEAGEWSWAQTDDNVGAGYICETCGASLPSFAVDAHREFHSMGEYDS